MILGDVIQLYEDNEVVEYVYLDASPEGGSIFLAKIPNIIYSQQVLKQQEKREMLPKTSPTLRALNNKLYFFVELTTEDFKKRLAMLSNPEYDENKLQDYSETVNRLCEEDISKIKNEILKAPKSAMPPKLIECMEKLK